MDVVQSPYPSSCHLVFSIDSVLNCNFASAIYKPKNYLKFLLIKDMLKVEPFADGTLTGNQNNLPDLSPVPFNMTGESETSFGDALNLLNNQDNTDSSFDNELFDIDLNIPDINKMQTLGMVP